MSKFKLNIPSILNQSGNSSNLIDLTTAKDSENSNLIAQFEKLIEFWIERAKIDKTKSHSHKINAFKKVLYNLSEYPYKITSKTQAMGIAGVGKGIADRIDQYLRTGTFDDFSLDLSPEDKLLIDLQNVHGIGIVKAHDFIKMGIRDINELRSKVLNNQITVINSIKIGLKYYDDFKLRIPHDEITRIYERIKRCLNAKFSKLIIQVAGSYRRQLPTSGDIDVLITYNPNNIVDEDDTLCIDKDITLAMLVKELESAGILMDHLTNDGSKKYMGVTKDTINNIGRRIDILYVPYENYFYSLLYFTGSKWLNTKMRSIAESMNMRLNEYSLTDNFTSKKHIVQSEQEIFQILGLKYLEPNKR